jgi:beta-lactamase superfamily II metal-dependent hydrolase
MNFNKKVFGAITACVLLIVLVIAIVITVQDPWKDREGYQITQYGTTTGAQCMFYTIKDAKGNLVIIDGGYINDEATVANRIKKMGGHVSAWILTHPHPDHIGAFNAIYPKLKAYGIKVDQIYATNVNHDRYVETAKDYDALDTYLNFCEVTKNAKNLKFLKEGDQLELLPGLRMKVIHGWDANVDKTENNLCNNGSLMFKLTAKKESMLFCADTQHEMEQYIVPEHKDELKCDYVQCGHHGNWGMTTEFYKLTGAKQAFVDGPNYLYDDPKSMYNGHLTVELFREIGARVYRLQSVPNTITLR